MKKAPFKSRKNFSATDAELWACVPKETRQLFSPAAGGFFQKAPFKSPKNFWATGAECSASASKATREPISRTAGAPAEGGF